MKRLYDKLAKDLNHKPFDELEIIEADQRRLRRSAEEVGGSAFFCFIFIIVLEYAQYCYVNHNFHPIDRGIGQR